MIPAPALKGESLDEVITTVTNGKNKMPSFKGRLSDTQIRAIAKFVATKLGH